MAAAPLEGWRPAIVHLDHGLREDSADEATLLAEMAERLGLPFHGEPLPVSETLADEGGNLEATARRLRYEALDRIARERLCPWVLTGHTADDVAETLWLWLLRGTGLRGLAPMPARRPLAPGSPVTLLRPLLEFRRGELQAHLREHGIPWLEDPSNRNLDLRRNRIRHRLLPMLQEEFGLDAVPAATRLVRQAGGLGHFLDEELARHGYPVLDVMGEQPALDRTRLRELPDVLAAWFLAGELGRLGEASDEAVSSVLALNEGEATGKSLDLPGGLRARFSDVALFLERRGEAPDAPPGLPQARLPAAGLPLPEAGELFLDGGWVLRIERRDAPLAHPDGELSARFDRDRLALPLRIANPQEGQRVQLLGGPGSRKLSDLFIDRKLPRPFRERVPLILDAEERVLWVPGMARGDQAPLSDETTCGLCLDLERSSS